MRFDGCCIDAERLAQVRDWYKLPSRFVLTLGAHRPPRNLARLVRAFARIAGDCPHSLLLTGSGDHRISEEVVEAARESRLWGRVYFPGPIAEEDLPPLCVLADLFVFPSPVEERDLPALRAIFCGTAVAASNYSFSPGAFGGASVLLGPASEEKLAAAMLKLLTDDEQRRLQQASWRRAAVFDGNSLPAGHTTQMAQIADAPH